MISNRTLAIAAVLALAIPALGAAAPVYANPVQEQLVEGHTVFAVLEVVDRTTTVTANFAAAVAVLVRENVVRREVSRFPGVLWFNDQYLVNPDSGQSNAAPRYPCGGAVLAVNQGDPDPRTVIGPNVATPVPLPLLGTVDPVQEFTGASEVPGNDSLSNVGGVPGTYGNDYAWLNGQGTPPYSDIPTGAISYRESYLITDPNDHMWQIDVYDAYTRLSIDQNLDPEAPFSTVYSFTVWAVNIMGSPVFVPDDATVACAPFVDVWSTYETVDETLCGYTTEAGAPQTTCDSPVLPDGHLGDCIGPGGPCRDNPSMGYQENSVNGYCYNGNAAPPAGTCAYPADRGTGPQPTCDGVCYSPSQPVRLYNALLYFKLEDLTVAGAPRFHGNDADQTQTNGCQVGTEWACPGGDDNAEGFSHPFRPTQASPSIQSLGTAEPCPDAFGGPNPSNHGGSTSATYDCDYVHATRNIDIYFSGDGRPFPPVVPAFDIMDTDGSLSPYHMHDPSDPQPDPDFGPTPPVEEGRDGLEGADQPDSIPQPPVP